MKLRTAVPLFIFVASLGFASCEDFGEPTGDSTITIVNGSDKTLDFNIDSSIEVSSTFDTDPVVVIAPHSSLKMHDWYRKYFTLTPQLRLFLFDKATVDSVPWDIIRTNNLYLKRIDFTLASLDSSGWVLRYP